MNYDVYLYGMTLLSNSYLLKDSFPAPDNYAEVLKKYSFPGGETGTCATVLSSLGLTSKIDGNYQGFETYNKITDFYKNLKVDTSALTYDKEFEGLSDHVFIDKESRTCFGKFQAYFSDGKKRWNSPNKEDIEKAAVIGIDPFFQEESEICARYSKELNKKYVTIDCPFDSIIHKYSEVNVISNEFIRNNYKEWDINKLFKEYINNTDGLVIFTFGAKNVMYGRSSYGAREFTPYKIKPVSTLGAGDTFKAGAIYALFKGMYDADVVSFACAAAAVSCMSFPIPLNPPTLDKIENLKQ